MSIWDGRYAGGDCHFGTEPNAFPHRSKVC